VREILGKAKTVRELLKGVKYSIDYYQREYKWHEKQIRELVDDCLPVRRAPVIGVAGYRLSSARWGLVLLPHNSALRILLFRDAVRPRGSRTRAPHLGGAERRESGQHLRPCSHRGYI
jgi:hypothetical protein